MFRRSASVFTHVAVKVFMYPAVTIEGGGDVLRHVCVLYALRVFTCGILSVPDAVYICKRTRGRISGFFFFIIPSVVPCLTSKTQMIYSHIY